MRFWFTVSTLLLVHTCINLAFAEDEDEEEDSSEYGVVDGPIATNCTCGLANKESGRIVGGHATLENEWPMIAEFSAYDNHLCGGTIVTKRHVITVSHCAFFPKSFDPLPYEKIDVYIGIHYVAGDEAFSGGELFSIEEFITHPDYDFEGKKNDIAVVLVDREIDVSDIHVFNAVPACLPIGNEKITGDYLTVLGWGLSEYGAEEGTDVLMKVKIKAVEHKLCQKRYRHYNKAKNICIYTKDRDSCQGDSGGPLLWRDPDTNRYVLVAATSYGKKCGIHPGVNTNITYYLPWIQETIAETDPEQQTCAKISSS